MTTKFDIRRIARYHFFNSAYFAIGTTKFKCLIFLTWDTKRLLFIISLFHVWITLRFHHFDTDTTVKGSLKLFIYDFEWSYHGWRKIFQPTGINMRVYCISTGCSDEVSFINQVCRNCYWRLGVRWFWGRVRWSFDIHLLFSVIWNLESRSVECDFIKCFGGLGFKTKFSFVQVLNTI